MFGGKAYQDKLQGQNDALLSEMQDLKAEVVKLQGKHDALKEAMKLSDEVVVLKRSIADLKADESRITEKYERERREVEHMVGLERKRQEFEIDQAKREATVQVREDAISAEKERFEEQMKFITDRLSKEVAYLKDDILKAVLDRLPTVTVDRNISETRKLKEA